MKRYADNLRIMRHEQLNWTATLAGLLHMQRYDEAIRYVEAQSEGAQDPRFHLAALQLGGVVRPAAGQILQRQRKGIELRFDPACQLRQIPAALNETELMSIVGNLLDNAVEATLHYPAPHEAIELYISDGSDELVIEWRIAAPASPRRFVIRCLNRASPPKRIKRPRHRPASGRQPRGAGARQHRSVGQRAARRDILYIYP